MHQKTRAKIFALSLTTAMLSIFLYLMARTVLFVASARLWQEIAVGALLLLAEGFTMLHAFGYFLNVYHGLAASDMPRITRDTVPELKDYPPVAIVVASYKEPLDVLEDTLTCFYNLTYPNKHIFFLDDTRYDLPKDDPKQMAEYRAKIDDLCRRIGVNLFRRPWRGAKAGMINDFLDYLADKPVAQASLTSFEDRPRTGPEKYVIVFDADMNPLPDFVEPLVAFMEQHQKLAFIQTPQYYSNFEANRVAKAAGLQQAVFYEYICEGKSAQDAMFCCGTNVILRRAALLDVGGFDETSVTEDFATSLRFHMNGWSSAYLNKICAFGMGPEDLGGYFKQQFRWALGTVGLLRSIAREFLRGPSRLPSAKWWEYFLSGTHYFVGWVFLIMAVCPLLYLFTDTPSYFARPELYFLFFLPYIILTVTIFLYSMSQRKYGFRELAQGILLQAITFPVYMQASLQGILGVRGSFGITPKGGSTSLPMFKLWPQLGLALACLGGFTWGMLRLYNGDGPALALLTNAGWSLYHFCILSTTLFFNFPEEDTP
ncbi:MAG: glycosyltransferase family 2 protein [Humidesulfovibrio sp.]|uniref:glycosyltransferase family 2 protein n=1 Tax=Humidesulfovibrio sp. TaxID=2910988 RepID=UPI0027FB6279|nr:glycosyltransferase family 2 protein [Humidesulfovibrio sp.]MDQ7836598.1 glycosyltransferase family 2 protein [Humidesulfovibrio sp.]